MHTHTYATLKNGVKYGKGKNCLFQKEQLKYKTPEAFESLPSFCFFLKPFHLCQKHPLEQAPRQAAHIDISLKTTNLVVPNKRFML